MINKSDSFKFVFLSFITVFSIVACIHHDKTARVLFYSNGSIKSIEQLDSLGNLNGICKYYYEANGGIKKTIQYKNGLKNGFEYSYLPNGRISARLVFKNEKLDGTSYYLYTNGDLQSKIDFKNGKKYGIEQNYYHNTGNTIKSTLIFINDTLFCDAFYYFETGGYKKYSCYSSKGDLKYFRFYNENHSVIKEDGVGVLEYWQVGYPDAKNAKSIISTLAINPPNCTRKADLFLNGDSTSRFEMGRCGYYFCKEFDHLFSVHTKVNVRVIITDTISNETYKYYDSN